MAKMPKELIDLLEQWHTIPMATVGEDGRPNVTPKSCMIRDEETLIFTELYFRQTYANLKKNSVASLCVWQRQPPYDAYKMRGRVEMVEEGPLIAEMQRRMREGHIEMFVPRTGELVAYIFHVDEIYDQTPGPSGGGQRIA